MNVNELERKEIGALLLCGGMLLSVAVMFAVSADAPSTLLLTLAGLTLSVLKPLPLPRSTRTYVYTAVSAMVVATLENQLFPVDGDRFFLLSGAFYCPLLIYLGIGVTFFDQRQISLTSISSVCLLGAMLAGNVVGGMPTNSRMPFSDAAVRHFHLFYGVMTVLLILCLIFLIRRAASGAGLPEKRLPRGNRSKWGMLALSLLVVGLSVLVLRSSGLYFERRFQNLAGQMFRHFSGRRSGKVVFGQEVDLWRTAQPRKSQDKTIILRCRSEGRPGYLRGRVYYQYKQGRWEGQLPELALPGREAGGRRVYTTFTRALSFEKSARPSRQIDFYPSRKLSSQVLFAPGEASEFDLVAQSLRDSRAGVLTPQEWDLQAGYSLRIPSGQYSEAFPLPRESAEAMDVYLEVPAALRQPLGSLVEGVLASGSTPQKPAESILQTVDYLQANCTYSLDTQMEQGIDPVLQFLTRLQKGHCELFASAAVLLLRQQGIPARYVTGFVCAEPHPGKNTWVARLEDAHAWAEAYLEDEKRWVLVEGTPASGVPDDAPDFNAFDGFLDRATIFWHRILANMKRGEFAEVIVALFGGISGAVAWIFWHPILTPLLLFGIGLLYMRRRSRSLRHKYHQPTSRDVLQAAFEALEIEARKQGVVRQPHMTVEEFSCQLTQLALGEQALIADLLRDYQRLRFAAVDPNPEDVDSLKDRMAAIQWDGL